MNISLGSLYTLLSSLIFFLYWLMVVSTTLRIVTRRRPATYVVSWLLIIYIVPILGTILYLLIGEVHLGKMRTHRAQSLRLDIKQFIQQLRNYSKIFTRHVSQVAKPIFNLCKSQTTLDGFCGNQIELLTSAEQVFDRLIADVDAATSNIEMVFYIWNEGGKADQLALALIRAANRGVQCRIMLDSAGSRRFFHSPHCLAMKAANIEIIEVLKVHILRFIFRRLDLRQHRKMIMIDNHISYTGSMNIVDPRYFKQDKDVGIWIDVMIRMNGPITTLMDIIFASDWQLETGKRIALPNIPDFSTLPQEKDHILQVIASGPGYTDDMIHQVLLTAIYAAQQQIIITTPYFVPSDMILQALCTAALRGVEVVIIVPQHNDSLMVKWASRAFFTELLEAGVKIFEFQHNLLHTKSVLIDEQLTLIGTVNLDMRSLWLNFEITTVIDNNHFGQQIKKLLNEYLTQSVQINKDFWLQRPFWQHIAERLFYFFSPLL
jgi:cardiolipin synthase A/B